MEKDKSIFKGVAICTIALAVLVIGAGFGYKYRHEIKNGINKIFNGGSSTVSPGGVVKPDTPLTSTVKLDIDGNITTLAVVTGETLESIPTPTKEGYVFKGWYINAKDGYVDLTKYVITEDVTFKAGFEKIKYLVTFIVDNEKTSIEVEEGKFARFPTPEKEGYTFKRWYDGVGNTIDLATYPVTKDVTLRAEFVKNILTVKFIFEDGSVITQEVPRGESTTLPDIPPEKLEKEGYMFIGWRYNPGWNDSVYEDISNIKITIDGSVFRPAYKGIDRTVRFIVDGQVLGSTMTVENGTSLLSAPIPEKEGFEFLGWKIGETLIENVPMYIITQDIDFIATFKGVDRTVRFIVDGEVFGDTVTIENGTSLLSAPIPEKEGFKFLGWQVDDVLIENMLDFVITQNVDFIATFVEANVIPYLFNENTLMGYLGNEVDVTLPSAYSIGSAKTQTTIVQNQEEFLNLLQGQMGYPCTIKDSSTTEITWETYDEFIGFASVESNNEIILNLVYPVSVSMAISQYIEGDDINVTRFDGYFTVENDKTEIIRVPSSITTIGETAFMGYSNLRKLICYSTPAFENSKICPKGLIIYVPDEDVEKVKEENVFPSGVMVLPLSECENEIMHTITFVVGENTYTSELEHGKRLSVPSNISIPSGMEIVDWGINVGNRVIHYQPQYLYENTVVSDMVLTATLKDRTVPFYFRVDGRSFHTANVKINELLDLADVPVPEKEGYRFVGWLDNSSGSVRVSGLVGSESRLWFDAVFEEIIEEEKIVYPFEVVDGTLMRFNREATDKTVIIPSTYSKGNKISIKTKKFNSRDYAIETLKNTYSDIQYPIKMCFSETGEEYLINSPDDVGDYDLYGGEDVEFWGVYFVYETYEIIKGSDYQMTGIGKCIFDEYSIEFGVEKLVIEEGIKEIGDDAFYSLDIKEVVLPRSIEKIGNYAFTAFDKGGLIINYAGTEEEWNDISFGECAISEEVIINFNYVG